MIVVGCWFVVRRLRYPLPWGALGRLLVASLLSAGIARASVAMLPSLAGLLVAIPAACAAYLLALRMLDALPAQDLAVLRTICESLPRPLEAICLWVIAFV
jgi:hypothetical protein